VRALRRLGRGSTTNLAAGIDTALAGFAQGAREATSEEVKELRAENSERGPAKVRDHVRG
jgi:hypothetical protein